MFWFALNRVLHPGEKRLLDFVDRECAHVPYELHNDVAEAVTARDPRQALDRLTSRLIH